MIVFGKYEDKDASRLLVHNLGVDWGSPWAWPRRRRSCVTKGGGHYIPAVGNEHAILHDQMFAVLTFPSLGETRKN